MTALLHLRLRLSDQQLVIFVPPSVALAHSMSDTIAFFLPHYAEMPTLLSWIAVGVPLVVLAGIVSLHIVALHRVIQMWDRTLHAHPRLDPWLSLPMAVSSALILMALWLWSFVPLAPALHVWLESSAPLVPHTVLVAL